MGSVAQTGKPEIVTDTTRDPRYVVDDEVRLAELTVPLLLQNKVIGVIDSEHPEKGFLKNIIWKRYKPLRPSVAAKLLKL